jgi:hypothetical protein
MTNVQIYPAIGLPIIRNAAMVGLLVMYLNARFDAMERRLDAGIDGRN